MQGFGIEDEEEEGVDAAVVAAVQGASMWMQQATSLLLEFEEDPQDPRSRPRGDRRIFQHHEALQCLHRDYLGSNPLHGADFQLMFRVSLGRFQTMMEDFAASGIPFYNITSTQTYAFTGQQAASLEARMLLPLKTLCYGVAAHCFMDYFQMSKSLARDCCLNFDIAMRTIYQQEYLRLPTANDMKRITTLHRIAHGVDGMFGSLDCSHTFWKNCPKAWQGSYKGKEDAPSIVLEGLCDYHLWFWHVSYGYAGTMNDKSILSHSPLMDMLLDGTFEKVETESGIVPYTIGEESFDKSFILVDGIYPSFSRFVRGIKEPIDPTEKIFTAWQEGARKDIERAFGVLQAKYQFISRPMQLMDLESIANRVTCCLLLHNIGVADRVMENNYREQYNPINHVEELMEITATPSDLQEVQNRDHNQQLQSALIGITNMPPSAVRLVARADRFQSLNNQEEFARLYKALVEHTNSKSN